MLRTCMRGVSDLLRGYNRSEREAIARSILLRAYSESFRYPNVHRRAALDVVIERPRERRTGRFSKSTSEKKKKMTSKMIRRTKMMTFVRSSLPAPDADIVPGRTSPQVPTVSMFRAAIQARIRRTGAMAAAV